MIAGPYFRNRTGPFRRTALLGVMLLFPGKTAFAQQNASAPAAQNQAATPATASVPGIPSYPNTARGLEKLMKDMIMLEKDGDKQTLANYARSLVLPDPENWFKSVFGDDLGAQLANVSDRLRSEIDLSAADMLAQIVNEKRTNVEAVRFDDSCNALAMPVEYPFLELRQRAEPLYDVRFSGHGETSVWLYFAYVDGAFRYIGSMRRKGLEATGNRTGGANPTPSQALRVAAKVQSAQLISQALPVYPSEAKRAGVQGSVIFRAIIAKDGSIRDLDVIEGVCALSTPAADAVRRWRYKPTLVNGEPVEVDTTITVIFTLGH
jgi:TonB family protein